MDSLHRAGKTPITEEEFEQGWHLCHDYDGLLVNAVDNQEGQICSCYTSVQKEKIKESNKLKGYDPDAIPDPNPL